MKALVTAALLLALASPAFAADDSSLWDCPHGVSVLRSEDGTFSANPPTRKKITQVADFKAPSPGDYVVQLDGKDCKYRTPYQRGVRDYREGLCYRARPYTDHGPEQKLWERGYYAQQKKEHNTRDWSHCHPK
jgi:hypothetical protein